MCDLVQDTRQCPVIDSTDNYEKKEMLSQCSSEEENKKDCVPEVLEKQDTCSSTVPLQLLEKLSNGVLSIYVDDIKRTSSSLNELMRNQNIVIETMQQENTRFSEALKLHNLEDMFAKMKLYHLKVQHLKKEMYGVYERTSKLKKRAMRLQQQKQKEALQKELQRDREMERDKQLAPKIATKSSNEK